MAGFEEDVSRAKRRKINDDSATAAIPAEPITSHQQLRRLLAFQQSASYEVKQGVRQFKDFLNSINDPEKEKEKAKKLRILKSYCDSQFVNHGDENSVAACFPDIIQTWNFAESNNHDSLLSLIPSVLALFLKTVSSQLEFREFGLALCKFLMQKEQLNLFNRGFTATKTKEHLISPCIRLLTEVVSFDGGATARLVYARRDITFKRLDVFLGVRKSPGEDDEEEDRRKPTLRRNAQRYMLANLKFQNASAKEDLVGQGKLVRAFLEDIRKDGRDIVIDIIRVLDKNVVGDSSLSRNVKTRFLSRYNLERLVTLYGFEKDLDEPVPEGESVSNEIHKFLVGICTDIDRGVLLLETGWYPTGSNPDVLPVESEDAIPLGLDSPVYFDKYKESVPIRNGNLSILAQFLRPDTDTRQMELLLKIFKAAPELVYDFFSKRSMFTSDPKPTPAWLGESAFLFSTVQLPVPARCGWRDGIPKVPPPVSVVIESILPRPLTQKILTRCLNLNTDVITLFAIRLITISIRKLQAVLKFFHAEREAGQELWNQASIKLVGEFCRRCPSMKDVIVLFRNTFTDNLQQQDAVLELLSMFYQVLPTLALEENFDISLTLVDVLKRLDNTELSSEDRDVLVSQLNNLLLIAQESLNMRWWQKPGSLEFSAFTSILKVFVGSDDPSSLEEMKILLQEVLLQSSALSSTSSFDALVKSLQASNGNRQAEQLTFLDNCIMRLVKKPVHYLDLCEVLQKGSEKPISLLVATISEQWPFIVKSGNSEKEASVSSWIGKLLGQLKLAGEDKTALSNVRNAVADATNNKEAKSLLKKAFKVKKEDVEMADAEPEASGADNLPSTDTTRDPHAELSDQFGILPVEGVSHPALNRWEREEIDTAVEEGHVGNLMLCLCSEHEEVRRQAMASISRFMAKLKASSYTEWQAIYVIAGEVLETVNETGLENPLPYIAGELAARAVIVLADPLHKLYGKLNKFMNKGPKWEVGKIPSYWIDKILLHEAEYDDSHHEEVSWLLELFIGGLRSTKDMDVYRRANVFERVLSLYNSPGLPEFLRKKIHHLIFRACEAGGSTTLLTRSGVLSWIESQVSAPNAHEGTLRSLATELYNTCDQQWIEKWSGATMEQAAADIAV